MKKDGAEGLSIAERLKAKSAEDLRDVEHVIRNEHRKLAESLTQSSQDALRIIEKNINGPIGEIEFKINEKRARMMRALGEIEVEPIKTMRRTMILSALIGGIVAMTPWVILGYLGMSVTEQGKDYLARRAAVHTEIDRLTALRGTEVMQIDGKMFLKLPGGRNLVHCGPERATCMSLDE